MTGGETVGVGGQRFVNVSDGLNPEKLDYAKLCSGLWKYMRTYRTDGPRCQVNPDVILKLLERSKEVLKNDAMVVRVTNPAIIFGPIYGEGDSLITLMSQAKLFPPNVTYVMLGGYVGHGFAQLECLFFLLCLKILYPDKVVLLKGHHEESISLEMLKVKEWLFARNISQEAHLEEILLEMKRTCSMMSACALLDENRVLCIPGGPGPVLRERGLAQLEKLKKGFQSVPDKKLVMEAAWSVLILNEAQKDMHGMPVFTPVRILKCIVRGRQIVDDGYLNKPKEVITLISAVAYLDNFRNYAAVLCVEHAKGKIIRYKMEEGEQLSLEIIKPGMGRNAVF